MWGEEHTNEDSGEHIRLAIDVIAADPRLNRTFEEDQSVPRDTMAVSTGSGTPPRSPSFMARPKAPL
jgi:hypothetical protein